MPVTAYVGPPGSGKTYSVVERVLLPALKQGRSVSTNIDGINREVLEEDGYSTSLLQSVDASAFLDPTNYPTEDGPGQLFTGGELLIVDEAYQVFPSRGAQKLDDEMLKFVRMHRHFVDENGRSMDIVLITQDVRDINVGLRRVLDFVFSVVNMRAVGAAKRYKIFTYTGPDMAREQFVRQEVFKYRPRVFRYYKSFAGGVDGKVEAVDSSQNIFRWYHKAGLAAGIPLAVLIGVWLLRDVYLNVTNSSKNEVMGPCINSGRILELRGKWWWDGRSRQELYVEDKGTFVRYIAGNCYFEIRRNGVGDEYAGG